MKEINKPSNNDNELKVRNENLVSSINLQPEGVRIVSDNIQFDGEVVHNSSESNDGTKEPACDCSI